MVTLLWGLTFPLIRSAVQDVDPFTFVAARFSLATVAFLPILWLSPAARAGLRRALWPGLALGALAWTSYQLQTMGLQSVEAGRAGFITGLSVIMVPLMSPLFRAGKPSRIDILASLVALAGLLLLTSPEGGRGFSVGDGLILGCAFTFATYIHVLQKVLARGHQTGALAFLQVVGIGVCALIALPSAAPGPSVWSVAAVVAIVICALLATVASFWLQTTYQGATTPERAALIFAMEPVFATGFAWLILGELLTPIQGVGAGVILAAVVGAEMIRG